MTMPALDEGHEITVGTGETARVIAYRTRSGRSPAIVWLGGYRSDMRGTKAEHCLKIAADLDQSFVRLDYSGHGESGGAFEAGTISRWTEEAGEAIAATGARSVILVGSSMGAWIALRLVAAARRDDLPFQIAGLLLLAPAPDFTEKLMRLRLSQDDWEAIERNGRLEEPSDYSSDPNIYTRALFEDGKACQVMTGLIETGCPTAIIQGMADPDVPYTHALELMDCLPASNVTMTLVRDGDHRLSRPQDLALIERVLRNLIDDMAH